MPGRRPFIWFMCSSAMLIGIAGSAGAQQRSELLRWNDEDNGSGDVTGYRIYYGTSPRIYTNSVDTGTGIIQLSVSVPAAADVYFAVTAYNEDAESFYSNEICRSATGGACTGSTTPSVDPPDDPLPPPPPPPEPEPDPEPLGRPGQPQIVP